MRRFTRVACACCLGSLLCACAPTLIGANSAGGMVDHVSGLTRTDALAKADAHCHQYGKVARISGQDPLDSTLTFDCVKP